ncbi:MAG: homing endonuclease associated repeat-containing protein [Cetobacterium sp.]
MDKLRRNSYKELLSLEKRELLSNIKDFMLENGCFTSTAYKKKKYVTFITLKRKLDLKNWQDLIHHLNLKDEYTKAAKRSKKQVITSKIPKNVVTEKNEELLEMYRSFSEKIGAVNGASMQQLKKHGFKYSSTVLLLRFGSWKDLKEAAGYTFNLGSRYSKDEVTKLLLNARAIKGRRLSQKELNSDPNLPVLETVLKFFKTTKISLVWDELERGLEKTTTSRKQYSLQEIKDVLYKEYCIKGAPLTEIEIKSRKKEGVLPGITTIYRHFKTRKIREVWDIVLKDNMK